MTGYITDQVAPAASTRTPHIAQPNRCGVCEQELPAGYGRHPTCDPRWLQPPSGATEPHTSAEADRTDER